MPSKWSQFFSLALLGLNIVHTGALNTRSLKSDVDYWLGKLEDKVVEDISKALKDRDGILDQFTMDYETYAKWSLVPS